jgi:large subunit ribosomal protein L6
MSRIGNSPVKIPEGVEIKLEDNSISVKGKLGELTQKFEDVKIKQEDGEIIVERPNDNKNIKSKHGLYRSLINNMIT